MSSGSPPWPRCTACGAAAARCTPAATAPAGSRRCTGTGRSCGHTCRGILARRRSERLVLGVTYRWSCSARQTTAAVCTSPRSACRRSARASSGAGSSAARPVPRPAPSLTHSAPPSAPSPPSPPSPSCNVQPCILKEMLSVRSIKLKVGVLTELPQFWLLERCSPSCRLEPVPEPEDPGDEGPACPTTPVPPATTDSIEWHVLELRNELVAIEVLAHLKCQGAKTDLRRVLVRWVACAARVRAAVRGVRAALGAGRPRPGASSPPPPRPRSEPTPPTPSRRPLLGTTV